MDLFLEAHAGAPRRIVLDLDFTDLALHGHQESRFFHGYYDHYCYLPLYIFAGDQLLCARLRPADQDGAAGAVEEVARIVAQVRQRWPRVQIILRADSGFCREELMGWCEPHGVDYILGVARNQRLSARLAPEMQQARQQAETTGKAARRFTEFRYRTRKSWTRERRVIAKAEYLPGKENPRFVVTSLAEGEPQAVYEKLYCARGEMENRIKEQLALFAGRLSTETMRANQLRLHLSAMAYTLLEALRRLALQRTAWAQAQVDTTAPTENRRPGADHRPPHLPALQRSLSLETHLYPCLGGTALLNPRPRTAPTTSHPATILGRAVLKTRPTSYLGRRDGPSIRHHSWFTTRPPKIHPKITESAIMVRNAG